MVIRRILGRRDRISGLRPGAFPGARSEKEKKEQERKKTEPVSQHPLSSWTNITAPSIPAAAALRPSSPALARRRRRRRTRSMCFMCGGVLQPAWTWTRLLILLHFLCLQTGRSNKPWLQVPFRTGAASQIKHGFRPHFLPLCWTTFSRILRHSRPFTGKSSC